MRAWMVGLALLAAAYVIPYAFFEEPSGWLLYVYWLVLGLASLGVAWAGTRGWAE